MSSAGTVNGRGFVISYSVQCNTGNWCRGGYVVTIDSTVASANAINSDRGYEVNQTSSDSHKFFTSKIGLEFTTGVYPGGNDSKTGSGSMKYILGT